MTVSFFLFCPKIHWLNIKNFPVLTTDMSVPVVCPADGTTDISVKVFEFSKHNTDTFVHLKINSSIKVLLGF